MNYKNALEYIDSELKGGFNPGLHRINNLLDLIGNPHKGLKSVLIAGTNGKGSITAMISSIARESGYKVGTYISPHLINITERYLINGENISENDLAKYITFLKEKIDLIKFNGGEIPSQFEVLTALAFLYLKDENVDISIIEVGLGGRYDATNVLNPMISVISSINYDHLDILGDSIDKIAYEKAGIIKKNGITVLYPQEYIEAEQVIKSISKEQNNKIVDVKRKNITLNNFGIDGQSMDYSYNGVKYNNIELPLLGDHQVINAAVAFTVALLLNDLGFQISEFNIKEGIKKTKWIGRFSIVSYGPLIVLDGAHNVNGVSALSSAIRKYFKGKELILVMGMLKDKEYDKSVKILASTAKAFVATEPISERSLKAEELALEAKKYCSNVKIEPLLEKAVDIAIKEYTKDSVICIAGSLYLIGEAYKLFN
ncbi:MAG: bifunctional folylpolyglutamate synthase/dihydrofolate synthase [Firmicutes bacterium]|nr:bifunctional folylpolyglutamate synthase/dihydrofolate synthase [Bacillota bacterium]